MHYDTIFDAGDINNFLWVGGGLANLVFPFLAPVGSKITVTYLYENMKFLLCAMHSELL